MIALYDIIGPWPLDYAFTATCLFCKDLTGLEIISTPITITVTNTDCTTVAYFNLPW